MIGKAIKKLTFGQFFLKRFIPLIIAAVVLNFLGTVLLNTLMELEINSIMFQQISKVQESILEKGDDEFGVHSEMMVGLYSDTSVHEQTYLDTAMIITDPVTGEVLVAPDFAVYAVVSSDEDDKNEFYICRDADVVEFYLQHAQLDKNIDFNDCYISDDGRTFRPGLVTVTEFEEGILVNDMLDERDFTPESMEGYTAATAKVCIGVGAVKDSRAYQVIKEKAAGRPSDEAYQALEALFVTSDMTTFYYDTLRIGGKEYDVYSISYYYFWDMFGMALLMEYIVAAVVVVLISLVWAKLAYNKYSAKYESDELRSTMVNALAHDLKSPLMAISGYAENLQSGAHPDKAAHYTIAILENTRCMNELIENTLELSKLDGTRTLVKQHNDAVALFSELYEKYRPQAESRGIEFAASGQVSVSADTALLRQALENLAANAVKYTDDGGDIEVKVDTKSIVVSNTFSGSIDKTAEELCRPFVRGDSSRTERSGTGMGLAIVKNICDMHGFKLDIKHDGGKFAVKITF